MYSKWGQLEIDTTGKLSDLSWIAISRVPTDGKMIWQTETMEVPMTLTLEVELPADLDRFHLPEAVHARLQALLDRQEAGRPLNPEERAEAEGLVDLAEFLTLLRLRAERLTP